MNGLIGGATNNIEMAVGQSNNVFVAIMNDGQLAGIFRSGNGGTSFTAMDIPQTNEAGGVVIGIQPTEKPGSPGRIPFSIVADPNNVNVL